MKMKLKRREKLLKIKMQDYEDQSSDYDDNLANKAMVYVKSLELMRSWRYL